MSFLQLCGVPKAFYWLTEVTANSSRSKIALLMRAG